MKEFYKELFDYNHQVNQKLLIAFNEHSDKASEKSVQWINHILNAHQVWISRIDEQEEPLSPWHVHSLGYLKDIDLSNYNRSLAVISNTDFTQVISYVNSVGKSYKNSVKDILFHVINHSTYHRGQIATDFKNSGLSPLVTDYIAFKR
ncbi:damage-inducible protein DinB [Sphingobacteriaceae bacterium]|nr:damage-inducible protein DinB [Sphingobacteriaceae bacterium]